MTKIPLEIWEIKITEKKTSKGELNNSLNAAGERHNKLED